MSGYVGSPTDALPFPLMPERGRNPLESYADSLSLLRGFTGLTNPQQPAPPPVGNQYTQSMTMPAPAFDPLAYFSRNRDTGAWQPVTQGDNARAEARQQERFDLGMTMASGFAGGTAPGGSSANVLRGYHGSPHQFAPTPRNPLGEFSIDHIGTGEGAQVYGQGVGYIAQREGIARGYRDALVPTDYRFTPFEGAPPRSMSADDLADHVTEKLLDLSEGLTEGEIARGVGYVAQGLNRGKTLAELRADVPNAEYLPDPMKRAALEAIDELDVPGFEAHAPPKPTVGGEVFDKANPTHEAAWHLDEAGYNRDKALDRVDDQIASLTRSMQEGGLHARFYRESLAARLQVRQELIQKGENLPKYKHPGHMYEVEMNLPAEHVLDYDVGFGQQHPKVQEALKARAAELGPEHPLSWHSGRGDSPNWKGEHAAPQSVAEVEAMVKAGIKGLRYRDASSRNLARQSDIDALNQDLEYYASKLTPEARRRLQPDEVTEFKTGLKFAQQQKAKLEAELARVTHNYVVFDANTLNIIRRYGIQALLGGAGAAAAGGLPQEQ